MLTFKCESCKKKITTDDSLAGQQGECPFCKAIVIAPGTPPDSSLEAARCQKCGARRPEMKRTCGFCGADFDAPISEPPKTRRVEAKTTRRKVVEKTSEPMDRRKVAMILGAVAAVGLVVLVMQFIGGEDEDAPKWTKDDLCRINMLALYDGLMAAQAHPESFPKVQGRAFWVEIARKQNLSERLRCPLSKRSDGSDYRGPAKEFKDMPHDSVIAVHADEAHEGGINVLTKSGEVLFVAKDAPLFEKAMIDTKD